MSKPIVVSVSDWNTSAIKYMAPKLNKQNGKAISIISKQTNRSLHVSTPLMMTWGVSDFVDDKGESDGKYSISLVFPNEEYSTPATAQFLQKLKDFENQNERALRRGIKSPDAVFFPVEKIRKELGL